MRASGQFHVPAVLLPEVHTRIPRTGGLVGTGTLWKREKSLAYRESNPWSSRSQLSNYAAWATVAQHYSAHSVVAAHWKLNSWLLWHTIFTLLNRVQWFPSLKTTSETSSWQNDVQQTPTRSKLLPPGYRHLRFLSHQDTVVGVTMGQML
jgi:hypothetical protein